MADTKKFLDHEGISLYDALIKQFIANYFDGRVFIGTTEEYQTAYDNGEVAIGTLVFLTDDENGGDNPESDSTTAVLGKAILGQMILGK